MIVLNEVATKLEKILNGLDSETSGLTNPTPYYFKVETEGFHIDHVERPSQRKNFIPVFVSSLGGQFNPVKGLKQGSYTFQVSFWFPVRFKESFFALGDFLVDAFVGSILNYGTISGKAVSNISAPQFGEIEDRDFGEFSSWVNEKWEKPIEKMEPYLSMVVSLFLSNAAPGLIYGNDFKYDLSFTYDNKKHTLKNLDWDGASLQSNSQAQSEQEEGADVPEAESFPFGTSYATSFKIYPNLNTLDEEGDYVEQSDYDPNALYYRKNDDVYVYVGPLTEGEFNAYHGGGVALYVKVNYYFYKELLKIWLQGKIQDIDLEISFKIANDSDLVYTRKCFVSSIVAPIEKGQLFGMTLTLAKKVDLEEEDD